MAWRCSWQVTCEMCENRGPTKRVGRDAEAAAVRNGWLREWGACGGVHLCPACAAGGERPENWPKAKAE